MPLAKILAGRISIDGTGENILGANAFGSISEDLTTFIFAHPKIRFMVDPVYVSIDLTTCPNNAHVFRFVGPGALDSAQHLVGWLQGTYSGLRAIIYNTGIPATRY